MLQSITEPLHVWAVACMYKMHWLVPRFRLLVIQAPATAGEKGATLISHMTALLFCLVLSSQEVSQP